MMVPAKSKELNMSPAAMERPRMARMKIRRKTS